MSGAADPHELIEIVPGNPADLDAIVGCWAELIAHHQPIDPRRFATVPQAETHYREHVRRQLDSPRGLALVAPDPAGGLHGYLLAGQGQRSPVYAVRQVAMIFDVAVRPAARRRGIGAALVADALRRFRARGLSDVQVMWSPDNAEADAFWRRQGFAPLLIEAYRKL